MPVRRGRVGGGGNRKTARPVSPYTAARELGHEGVARIEDTCGRLQKRHARLSEVRYAEADVIEIG